MALPNPPIQTPNFKNFTPVEGFDTAWTAMEMKFPASTAIEAGTAIGIQIDSNDTTGYKVAMGAENVNGADFVGILLQPILTTDADYATVKTRLVYMPMTDNAQAYFYVGAGTLSEDAVGRTVEFHTGGKNLAVETKGKGARITKVIKTGGAGVGYGICTFPMPKTETA